MKNIKDQIIEECIELIDEQQIVSLYEKFNGGIFSKLDFLE